MVIWQATWSSSLSGLVELISNQDASLGRPNWGTSYLVVGIDVGLVFQFRPPLNLVCFLLDGMFKQSLWFVLSWWKIWIGPDAVESIYMIFIWLYTHDIYIWYKKSCSSSRHIVFSSIKISNGWQTSNSMFEKILRGAWLKSGTNRQDVKILFNFKAKPDQSQSLSVATSQNSGCLLPCCIGFASKKNNKHFVRTFFSSPVPQRKKNLSTKLVL